MFNLRENLYYKNIHHLLEEITICTESVLYTQFLIFVKVSKKFHLFLYDFINTYI